LINLKFIRNWKIYHYVAVVEKKRDDLLLGYSVTMRDPFPGWHNLEPGIVANDFGAADPLIKKGLADYAWGLRVAK
jgi:hypothetical protein